MKQFVISRRVRAWLPTEYFVREVDQDAGTGHVVFYAVHQPSWKARIDVYPGKGSAGSPLFSIKSRDLLGLAYDIVDGEGKEIGVIDRMGWFSPTWCLEDKSHGVTAELVRTSLFLYKEHRLVLDGQRDGRGVCLFSEESGFFNARLRLSCLEEPVMNSNLILSVGLLLLRQVGSDGGGGSG